MHAKDHTPVETHRFCADEDEEVPYDEIANGYETDEEMVILTDAELAAAAPHRSRTIDIEAFVDLDDVDPIYFDHPYLVMPSGEAEGIQRAYRLLVEVMSRTERAALGRVVMRTKEFLALIRAREERLVLSTLLWHDEVRPTGPISAPTKKDRPAKKEVDAAVELIESFSCTGIPRATRTTSRATAQDHQAQEQGPAIEVPGDDEQPSPVPDLMAALERSLEEARSK